MYSRFIPRACTHQDSFNRTAQGFSPQVLDFVQSGSSLSIRSFIRIATSLSLLGGDPTTTYIQRRSSKIGACVSILDVTACGSAISMRSEKKFGKNLSVMNMFLLGSSMSMRSKGKLGSQLSVFQFASLSSALSLRRSGEVGRKCSILDFASLGSDFSVRGYRCGVNIRMSTLDMCSLGSALSVRDRGSHGIGLIIFA